MLFDSVDLPESQSFCSPAKLSVGSSHNKSEEGILIGIGSLLTSDFAIGNLAISKPDEPAMSKLQTDLPHKLGKEGEILKSSPTVFNNKDIVMRPTDELQDINGSLNDEEDEKSVHSSVNEDDADDRLSTYSAFEKDAQTGFALKRSSYGANLHEKMASMSMSMRSRISGVIMDPAPPLRRSGPMVNLASDIGPQNSLLIPRDSDETVHSKSDLETDTTIFERTIVSDDGTPCGQSCLELKSHNEISGGKDSFEQTTRGADSGDWAAADEELFNEKGILVIQRVSDKLTGLDFNGVPLLVKEQIDFLIKQATSNENLCSSFFGWCPFW